MENNNKLFAVLAWLQLIIGVLLATVMMWGYANYKASLGLFVHSVAASIGAVSDVVIRTAETVEARRELLDQTSQMLLVTRKQINELRVAGENQAKLAPQYAQGLRSASTVTGKLGNSMGSLGDGLLRISIPSGIQFVGMKPVIVMSQPLAAKGQELKDNSRDIKAISDSLSGISELLGRDSKTVSTAFVATTEQALKVLTEVEKTLAQIKTQDLPKAIADLKTAAQNLRSVSAQIDMVGNGGLILLIVGLLLASWCIVHSLGSLMLVKSRAFEPINIANQFTSSQLQGNAK